MDIRFEWDLDKEAANRRKHDITFGSAVQAFDDPFALTELERIVEGEERWQTLGMIDGQVILLVAHTIRAVPDKFEP